MVMRVLIGLALMFALSELILNVIKRSKASRVIRRNDRGSRILIWVVITISLTAGFTLANYGKWDLINYLIAFFGCLIYLAGMILRWLSIYQLKEAFTVDVAVSSGQQLKKDGLYSMLRHPSYLGELMIVTGLSIALNNLLSVAVITIPVFLAIYYRISVEEKLLLQFFGEEYKEYSEHSYKILPFIL